MESAPYLEGDNYYTTEDSKSSEIDKDDSVVLQKQQEEDNLREQLFKTEEEIVTLRQVLNSKLLLAQDLKRQLGITTIAEIKGDFLHGINAIKESNTFKTTTTVMKNVKEKTSSSICSASSNLSLKLGMLRNSNTFKSIEGKMGTAYTSVKKDKISFKSGDKIFAKVKGFVYWPARVNPIPEDVIIPPSKIPIFFYGTHEVYFISATSCFPFDEKNKARWGKPRTRSHFNEGMDEIENNPTLLQYGVDPKAEEYLAQFYDFKRSNEITNNSIKSESDPKNISENLITMKTKKEPTKLRNKSGSSISTKENKSTTSFKNDQDNVENDEMLVVNAVKEENKPELKDEVKLNEEIKEDVDIKIAEVAEEKVFKADEILPKLRSRSKSSTKIETKKRKSSTVINNKSEEGSDSEAVCSDNPMDEDFEPAKKTAKVSTKGATRTRKSRKSLANDKTPSNIKRNSRSAPKVVSKVKKDTKIKDSDSLSSISSIEDWKEKDEKRRKEHEEAQKILHKEELLKEEQAIKEASRQARKKNHSKSSVGEEKLPELLTTEVKEYVTKLDTFERTAEVESCLNGKEVIVEISIRDIGKTGDEDLDLKESVDDIALLKGDSKLDEISNGNDISKSFPESEVSLNDNIPGDIMEEKHSDIITEKNDIGPAVKNTEKLPQNKRVSKKQPKKERPVSKKSNNSRKRLKLESDESDQECIIVNKKSKLNQSEDSDCEIVSDGIKKSRVSHNSENDLNENLSKNKVSAINNIRTTNAPNTDIQQDTVKKLHSFNSDIRSSLVLGHEDYTKCINTFKHLCTMELDVLSLVSVWQLMDTVKKCRRYKRNESVKNEAQVVYRRFLDVYSKSTADERNKAEAVLSKYRHGHNSSSELIGSKADSAVNGHSQNLSMPSSVEDMFYNKQTNSLDNKNVKVTIESVESPPKPNDVMLSLNTQKEQLDAEKMRLLSADLEAKVSDILSKIEKNSSLSNPINQQSLSHLLPQQSQNSSIIELPVEWESVNDIGRRAQERKKIIDVGIDLDGSDDDDEDVEAIVKRIENVPIKMIEVVDPEEEEEEEEVAQPPSGSTSALDWRIENLFNSKNFISSNSKKESHNSAVKKHRTSKPHTHKDNVRQNPSPPRVIVSEKKEETKKEINKKVDLSNKNDMLEDGEIVDVVESESASGLKNADNDIYDLLGV